MMQLHQMLLQIEWYFDAKEYKVAIKQLKKTLKFIKRLRRKSK